MGLMTVEVNGKAFVVDAETKALAKAFGKKQVVVEVRAVSREDLAGLDMDTIPVLVKANGAAEATDEQESE